MKALLSLQKDVIIREAGISEDDEIRSCKKPNYCSKAQLPEDKDRHARDVYSSANVVSKEIKK